LIYFRTIVWSALVGIFLGVFAGWYITDLRWTSKEAAKTIQAERKLSDLTSTYRAREESLQALSDATASKFSESERKVREENTQLVRKLSAGSVHLTARTAMPKTATGTQSTSSPDAAGTCVLSETTSADLAALAGKADEVATKLNALQEYVRGLESEETQ